MQQGQCCFSPGLASLGSQACAHDCVLVCNCCYLYSNSLRASLPLTLVLPASEKKDLSPERDYINSFAKQVKKKGSVPDIVKNSFAKD